MRLARERAPVHPKKPEADLHVAVARLLVAIHGHVRAAVLSAAPGYAGRRSTKRGDSQAPSEGARERVRQRLDADHPLDGDNRDPLLHSAFFSTWHNVQLLLHTSPFRRIVDGAAKKTAKSVNQQTAKALGDPEHDPDLDTDAFAPDAVDKMEDLAADSLELAEYALNKWADEDGEDEDALGEDLDGAMSGVMGKGLAWVGLAFGSLFGRLVKESQQAGGVASAIWLSMLDTHVRPAHAALDGVEFDWDEPPLKAEDADCGEDCFPGTDFGCRCVSSPVVPVDESDD